MVLQDYGLRTYFSVMDPFKSGGLETVSQLYLTGRGERSYFDARAMYFYGLSASDVQSQLPIVHPVIDYRNRLANPLFGGELTLPRQPHQPVARECRLRPDHAEWRSTPGSATR